MPRPKVFTVGLSAADREFLLKLMRASAWDVISQTFHDPRTQTHLYRMTSEMMVSPSVIGWRAASASPLEARLR